MTTDPGSGTSPLSNVLNLPVPTGAGGGPVCRVNTASGGKPAGDANGRVPCHYPSEPANPAGGPTRNTRASGGKALREAADSSVGSAPRTALYPGLRSSAGPGAAAIHDPDDDGARFFYASPYSSDSYTRSGQRNERDGASGQPANYVLRSSQNPRKSMRERLGNRGFKVGKPFTLSDPRDILAFIFYNSFRDSVPFSENAAFQLMNGPLIVVPNNGPFDGPHSIVLHLGPSVDGYATCRYEGALRRITDIYHSHPTYPAIDGRIGISDNDVRIMLRYPSTRFFIINNETVYRIWQTKAYDSVGTVH